MAISDTYVQKTLFLVGNLTLNEEFFKKKCEPVYKIHTLNFEEELKKCYILGYIYSKQQIYIEKKVNIANIRPLK